MTRVLLIRHAATAWNAKQRIQGRTDIDLSEAGRKSLAGMRLPSAFGEWTCVASPLARAMQTAGLLGLDAPRPEPRLQEMHWGAWEGRTLATLRAELGDAMRRNEARGLDFRPAGGESPRDVAARVADWLAEVAADGRPVVAVTHKGVIRAALALATGWDMREAYPRRLHRLAGHLFETDAAGVRLVRLNVALERA